MASEIAAIGVSVAQSQAANGSTSTQAILAAEVVSTDNNGDVFGASVVVSLTAAATKREQDGQKAVSVLQQEAVENAQFNKKAAADKLALAIKEFALIKLLGTGIEGAKEAARLAKQIASAVSQYSGASSSPADPTTATAAAATTAEAVPTDATTADAATAADAASANDTAASDSTAAATQSTAAATAAKTATTTAAATAAPSDPDGFYALANAALDELRKYLRKTLPALLASPVKKTRDDANKVLKDFDEATASVSLDEQGAGGTDTSGTDTGDSGTGDAGTAATIAAPIDLVA